MKIHRLLPAALALLIGTGLGSAARAADASPPPPYLADLRVVRERIISKFGANPNGAAALAPEWAGLEVQVGIKNLFNTVPPFDASSGSGSFYSNYGDARLHEWWLSVTKRF